MDATTGVFKVRKRYEASLWYIKKYCTGRVNNDLDHNHHNPHHVNHHPSEREVAALGSGCHGKS